MIASSGTEPTITYFLRLVKQRSPSVNTRYIMSDRDHAQINACLAVFTTAILLLCWWHVLHAWQQHFRVLQHPELWVLLKSWIRITDYAKFQTVWAEVRKRASEEFADLKFLTYLETTWMSETIVRMWSAMYRIDRSIFEDCDTNMLIEAYVHISFCSIPIT